MYYGIGASNGIVIASAVFYEKLPFDKMTICDFEIEKSEEKKLRKALHRVQLRIAQLQEKAIKEWGSVHGKIFDVYMEILRDSEYIGKIFDCIKNKSLPAVQAVWDTTNEYLQSFENIQSEYLRSRWEDIYVAVNELVKELEGQSEQQTYILNQAGIIIAEELSPADLIEIRRKYISGIVTAKGGFNSHTAIIARSLEIPYVLGVGSAIYAVAEGEKIIVDGNNGIVIPAPSDEQLQTYLEMERKMKREQYFLEADTLLVSKTGDGKKIELNANIGTTNELKMAVQLNAAGIGLLRTEFLFLENEQIPGEEEQLLVYLKAAESMKDKSVTIRTFDISKDKNIFAREEKNGRNYNNELMIQIRAILQAAVYKNNIQIMFPMIIDLDDFKAKKNLVFECMKELENESKTFYRKIPIGATIEVPGAIMMIEDLCKETDFISIGSNDLTQYTLVSDRMNEDNIQYHPAVFRLIQYALKNTRGEIPFSLCGEIAGDPLVIPVLVGMGIDRFSICPARLPIVRNVLRKITYVEAIHLAQRIMNLSSAFQVKLVLQEFYEQTVDKKGS